MESVTQSMQWLQWLQWLHTPMLWEIVGRSLQVSLLALLPAFAIALPLGGWVALTAFRGRAVLLLVLNTLLALPSVLVGLLVYLLLSHGGPLGSLGWLYSRKAMVLAQAVLVLPVLTALIRRTLEDAEHDHGEQLRALGAKGLVRVLLLAMDERRALLTIALVGFGRAVSEVGAVMVVGGNIEGFTRVMTTAIALETSKGDVGLAIALGGVLLMVVMLINGVVAWLAPRAA